MKSEEKLFFDLSKSSNSKSVVTHLKKLSNDKMPNQNYNTNGDKSYFINNFLKKLQNAYSSCSQPLKQLGIFDKNYCNIPLTISGNMINVNNSLIMPPKLSTEEEKKIFGSNFLKLNESNILNFELKSLHSPKELDISKSFSNNKINDISLTNSIMNHDMLVGNQNLLISSKDELLNMSLNINNSIDKSNKETILNDEDEFKNDYKLNDIVNQEDKVIKVNKIVTKGKQLLKKMNSVGNENFTNLTPKRNSLRKNTQTQNSTNYSKKSETKTKLMSSQKSIVRVNSNLIKDKITTASKQNSQQRLSIPNNISDSKINSQRFSNSNCITELYKERHNNSLPKDSKNQKFSSTKLNSNNHIDIFANPNKIIANDHNEILNDLEGIFGENLENFDEELLFNTLEEFDTKILIKSLIFLSLDQKKMLKDTSKKLIEESAKRINLSNEIQEKNNSIFKLEEELNSLKYSLNQIIKGNNSIKTKDNVCSSPVKTTKIGFKNNNRSSSLITNNNMSNKNPQQKNFNVDNQVNKFQKKK